MPGACRVGIDVGGTFTDFVLFDRRIGHLVYHKEPSTPMEPAEAVAEGLREVLRRATATPADLELVVHGTTIALNAILQRRGARVALVLSKGFGDTMELGRGGLPNSYNYKHPKQKPLIPRDLVFEVPARTRADGTIIARPQPAALSALADRIKAKTPDAVTVALINAYAHPALENEVADTLGRLLPDLPMTRSAQLWPEIREYERTLVAALNGFVHPMMDRYYAGLERRLRALGVSAPIHITTSNGGTISIESARRRPVETLLSGPAAGVVAAARVADRAGLQRIVTVDMGGTSSDMAISQHAVPEYTTQTRLGEFPLVLPVVNVWAIGAGGGSIVWVDEQGVLKVGPRSAGAVPGPVCYGRGGNEPTITDCYLLAGYLDPAHFLGGRMALDPAAAAAALDGVGARIGLEGADRAVRAADAALRVATAKMATEILKGMAQRGLDPSEFGLMPYGGAGPTQANLLAEEARLGAIVVPPSPGTFCALGAILADIRRDFARSHRLTLGLDGHAVAVLRRVIEELMREATTWISEETSLIGKPQFEVSCDMQYPRTAFELNVLLPEDAWRYGRAGAISEAFHAEHERLYGFRDKQSAVDVTTIRLRVTGKVPPIDLPPVAPGDARPEPIGRRNIFQAGAWIEADVFARAELRGNSLIDGPAIVEQEDTTTWIAPGWSASVDRIGSLRVARNAAPRQDGRA
jgi:N-methylhydantoinase A